jgi:hypothetical protein
MVGKLCVQNDHLINVYRGKVSEDTAAYGISIGETFIGAVKRVHVWKEPRLFLSLKQHSSILTVNAALLGLLVYIS